MPSRGIVAFGVDPLNEWCQGWGWNGRLPIMWSWYADLRGLDLLEATLGILAGIVTAFVGFVAAISRAIGQGLDHNWRKCTCSACGRRRQNSWSRQHSDGQVFRMDTPRKVRPNFLATTELRRGQVVVFSGRTYRVITVRRDARGYLVELKRLGEDSFICTVGRTLGSTKMWEPGE